jgi:hypothetical protein
MGIDDLVPLLIDTTKYIADPATGKIVGLSNRDYRGTDVEISNFNALTFRHNGEARSLSGRSMFENARLDWSRSMQAMEKFGQYLTTICNVIPIIHGPIGTVRDASGAFRPSSYIAYQAIADAMSGAGLFLPNEFASILEAGRKDGKLTSEAWQKALEAADKSQWKIDFVDPGGLDRCAGFLAAMEHFDYLKVRAITIPEQALLHTSHGTRGQSQQHDNTADIISEMLYWEMCEQIQLKVDDFLEVNKGKQARGSVQVVPPRISDENSQGVQKLLETLAANAVTGPSLMGNVDVREALDDQGVPVSDPNAGGGVPALVVPSRIPGAGGNGSRTLPELAGTK